MFYKCHKKTGLLLGISGGLALLGLVCGFCGSKKIKRKLLFRQMKKKAENACAFLHQAMDL